MKTIYWNHTPNADANVLVCTFVANIEGRTYRVTLNWDRFYAFQTHGKVAVRDGNEFKTLLHLLHHDMPRFAEFDAMPPQKRGEFARGNRLPGLLRMQAEQLADLGARIMKGTSQ